MKYLIILLAFIMVGCATPQRARHNELRAQGMIFPILKGTHIGDRLIIRDGWFVEESLMPDLAELR